MPREKPEYRVMLSFLVDKRGFPLTMTKKQTAEAIGVSRVHLDKIIAKGHIKMQDGKVPVGSVASYLCG